MNEPLLGTNQCLHGRLARSCELCERDREIADLRAELKLAQDRVAYCQETKRYVPAAPVVKPPAPAAVEALRELVALRDSSDSAFDFGGDKYAARVQYAWAAARAALQSRPAGGEG